MHKLALAATMAFILVVSGHARELMGWHPEVKQGLEKAKKEGKDVLVFLTNNTNSKVVKEAIDSVEFKAEAGSFVVVSVDTSFKDKDGSVCSDLLKKYNYELDSYSPIGLLLDSDGREFFQFSMDPASFNPNYTTGKNVARFILTGNAYKALRNYWMIRAKLCENDVDRAVCFEHMFRTLNGIMIVGYEKEFEIIFTSHPNEMSKFVSKIFLYICHLKTQMVNAKYEAAIVTCGKIIQDKNDIPPSVAQYVVLTQALAKYELFNAGQGAHYLKESYDELIECFKMLEGPLSQRAGEYMIKIKRLLNKRAP